MNAPGRPGRYLYVPIPRIFIICAGIAPLALALALVLGCFAFVIFTHDSNREFDADPTCLRTIAMDTPESSGKSCTIEAGAITRAYTQETTSASGDDTTTSDHFDFTTTGGRTLDVNVQDSGSNGIFAKAKENAHATPAVAETFDGTVAFIATRDGMLSGQADPSTGVFLSTMFSIVFGVIALFCIPVSIAIFVFVRAKPA